MNQPFPNRCTRFRTGFTGQVSLVHLFWGAFDLAVTRFSGRKAPPHPGGIPTIPVEVMPEAFSQEVSSAGCWLGSPDSPEAAFCSYCYPTLKAFREHRAQPPGAYDHKNPGEFVLPYNTVRQSPDPDEMLMLFLQTAYEAAATAGHWSRTTLEKALSYLQKPNPGATQ